MKYLQNVRILPVKIVLDTNFLTIPAEFGVDIFSEVKRVIERSVIFIVLQPVLTEIEYRLARPRNKAEERKFRIAMSMIDRCDVVSVHSSDMPVDDVLIDYAHSNNAVIATCDKELKRKAKNEGIPVLYLRGRKYIALDGSVL